MSTDEIYMRRALDLAILGDGFVAPNPMVGAVVVHEGKIIGEGYHEHYGEAHAEVNAIHSVKDQNLLSESTIYVTLEPCAHHGKTPPCANLIVEKELKRVVIGCGDSFAAVNGKGIELLKNAGIEVTTFVLEDESRKLNRKFFTAQEKKRPHVLLKWAESANGKIDNQEGTKDSVTWISQPETQPLVHKLRSEYAAILVGKSTVIQDNPSLTVRAVSGPQPIRIVLDSRCELQDDRKLLNDGQPTWILNTQKAEENVPIRYIQLDAMTPSKILETLHTLKIQSVLIEGGRQTLQSFIDANLWDEAIQIIGQNIVDIGTEAPKFSGTLTGEHYCFGDRIKHYCL